MSSQPVLGVFISEENAWFVAIACNLIFTVQRTIIGIDNEIDDLTNSIKNIISGDSISLTT